MKEPLLIENIHDLRERLIASNKEQGKVGELWHLLRTSARSAPKDFGWFTFFVALITKEEQDINNAKEAIYAYLAKLEPMSFCTGLQFHFWCFAFPHAKICLYFQWLCSIDAFTKEEEEQIKQQLISYQFVNFYYGMRSKPDPECIDNQTLSLTLSCTLVGYLFGQGDNSSSMAAIMLRDGSKRLPYVIGDMPESGYSGEGSSYMDCVNGPAIPLAVELLQRITGEKDLLYKAFTQGGGKPVSVLKMVAREFMPGGLLLPWDNYGYQFGVRGAIAYGASKTRLPLFFDVLENKTTWTYDIGTGWAYDDLVWTLIYWPSMGSLTKETSQHWYEPMVGGALCSEDGNHYLMQMWDPSEPLIPTRSHVNPNSLVFTGFGVPISADGSPNREVGHRFWFDDTWRRVSFLEIGSDSSYNYGDGCGGAHSIILLDGVESLRAHKEYEQITSSNYTQDPPSLVSNVTPIYQENFPDVKLVTRKTTLLEDRVFVIEDLVVADDRHTVTSRFLLRPSVELRAHGFFVKTPEGVCLSMVDALKTCGITGEQVDNFPLLPDNQSYFVDFAQEGQVVRGLYVALMSATVLPRREIDQLHLIYDESQSWDVKTAGERLKASPFKGSLRLPAYMEQEVPNYPTWWYRATIDCLAEETYLKLPSGLIDPLLYINGEEIPLEEYKHSMALLGPRIPLPKERGFTPSLDILLRTNVPISHYDGGGDGTIGLTGGLWLCEEMPSLNIIDATYDKGTLTVVTDQEVLELPYDLMAAEVK